MKTFKIEDSNGHYDIYIASDDLCHRHNSIYLCAKRVVNLCTGSKHGVLSDIPIVSVLSNSVFDFTKNRTFETEADAALWVETGILPDYMI